jgi:MFS family permease
VTTLLVFMIGSALVAVSTSFWWIVAARAIQAVGGGGVVPVSMAIVVAQLPPERRLMGLGAIAAAAEAGALIGPAWGGMITHLWGWRAVFWTNLPLVAPSLVGVCLLSRKELPREEGVDWIGAGLLGAALATLTYGLVDDPISPRPGVLTLGILGLAGVLVLAFGWRELTVERRGGAPLVRLQMLAERGSVSANFAMFLLGMGLITALMGVPLFVNLVLTEGALEGGMTLMRLTVAVPLGALAGGWVAGRIGLRATASLGCFLVAMGFAGLQGWDRSLTEAMRSIPQLVGGFGFGLVLAPLSAAVLRGVGEGERATAAAWLTLSRMAGMLVGAALLTSHGLGRFYARAGALDFGSPEFLDLILEVQIETFREVFIVAGIVMAFAALVSLGIGVHGERPEASS